MAGGEIAKLWAKVGVDIGDFERGMKKVNEGMSAGKVAAMAFGGVLSVYAARQLADYGIALAKVGTQHMRLETSFRQAAKAPDALLASMKRASSGTIAETALISNANKAMALGLGDDAEKMGKLLEVARFKGRAMGLSTQQAFSDLVTGVGRASPEILDNLGIVVNAEARYRDYAASVGKAADELSGAEKTAALLNSVLTEGQRQIAAAGGMADDAADSFERMDAKIEDAKTKLGMLVAPAVVLAVDIIASGADTVQKAIDDLKGQSPVMVEFALTPARQQLVNELESAYRSDLADMGNMPGQRPPAAPTTLEEYDKEFLRRQAEGYAALAYGASASAIEVERAQKAIEAEGRAWLQSEDARQSAYRDSIEAAKAIENERLALLNMGYVRAEAATVMAAQTIEAKNLADETAGLAKIEGELTAANQLSAQGFVDAVAKTSGLEKNLSILSAQYKLTTDEMIRDSARLVAQYAAIATKMKADRLAGWRSQYSVGGTRYAAGKMTDLKMDDYEAVTAYNDQQTADALRAAERLAETSTKSAKSFWNEQEQAARESWDRISGFAEGAFGKLKPEEKKNLMNAFETPLGTFAGSDAALARAERDARYGLVGGLVGNAQADIREQYLQGQISDTVAGILANDPTAMYRLGGSGTDLNGILEKMGLKPGGASPEAEKDATQAALKMGQGMSGQLKPLFTEMTDALKAQMDKLPRLFNEPLPVSLAGGGGDDGGGGGGATTPTTTSGGKVFIPGVGYVESHASGGYVGWGLPRGTPVLSMDHAGERVLNGRQQREQMGGRTFIFHSGAISVTGADVRTFLQELEQLRSNQT